MQKLNHQDMDISAGNKMFSELLLGAQHTSQCFSCGLRH